MPVRKHHSDRSVARPILSRNCVFGNPEAVQNRSRGKAWIWTTLAPHYGRPCVEEEHVRVQHVAGGVALVFASALVLSASAVSDRTVSFPDPALRSAVTHALGTAGVVKESALSELTALEAVGAGIRDLGGLEHATGLQSLDLSNNQIRDISPLGSLNNLRWVNLQGNQIRDAGALGHLTALIGLDVADNLISELGFLRSLVNLRELRIVRLPIQAINALEPLENLRVLWCGGNHLKDISVLEHLQQLELAYLWGNDIRDLLPLTVLPRLEYLNLCSNNLSDISELAKLTRLRVLELDGNNLQDLAPLSGLEQLGRLTLEGNQVRDLTALPALRTWDSTPDTRGFFDYSCENPGLDLRDNRISDLSVLVEKLPRGQWVALSGNPIDFSPASAALQVVETLRADGVDVCY
jgi:Leucine-rich repeat (LRR) protein